MFIQPPEGRLAYREPLNPTISSRLTSEGHFVLPPSVGAHRPLKSEAEVRFSDAPKVWPLRLLLLPLPLNAAGPMRGSLIREGRERNEHGLSPYCVQEWRSMHSKDYLIGLSQLPRGGVL